MNNPQITARSMSYPLFDTHCHLDLPELWPTWPAHWCLAQQAGVQALLIPAVAKENWPRLLKLCQTNPQFYVALGIHPWWAIKHHLADIDLLALQLQQPEVSVQAIGEIGLDFALDADSFVIQQQLFAAQLALAKRHKLPVILHHRKSQPALLAEIKRQQFSEGGILHAFSGSQQQAHAFIDAGFKLGIGGTITYSRAEKTRNAVSKLPLSALVLETDAPAMPLCGFQGQVNTPAQLAQVFDALCQLRDESPPQLAAALWQNSRQILRLS
ncbi:TatD family hydrolase [Rheinheimera sp. UJ51]|uniref:TatD family hydrolase n=1 Tax=Rheinheimera sp. UJ51 TaxID=2892446 RepID=UPI001E5F9D0D|nr:TatD family hydrolase [Rheinheimera sp. UJ51]MCC5453001.1 TatD family hydrolase [Rheinheimera sp. UJ51]